MLKSVQQDDGIFLHTYIKKKSRPPFKLSIAEKKMSFELTLQVSNLNSQQQTLYYENALLLKKCNG